MGEDSRTSHNTNETADEHIEPTLTDGTGNRPRTVSQNSKLADHYCKKPPNMEKDKVNQVG